MLNTIKNFSFHENVFFPNILQKNDGKRNFENVQVVKFFEFVSVSGPLFKMAQIPKILKNGPVTIKTQRIYSEKMELTKKLEIYVNFFRGGGQNESQEPLSGRMSTQMKTGNVFKTPFRGLLFLRVAKNASCRWQQLFYGNSRVHEVSLYKLRRENNNKQRVK